jgi:hypothetical protein
MTCVFPATAMLTLARLRAGSIILFGWMISQLGSEEMFGSLHEKRLYELKV